MRSIEEICRYLWAIQLPQDTDSTFKRHVTMFASTDLLGTWTYTISFIRGSGVKDNLPTESLYIESLQIRHSTEP